MARYKSVTQFSMNSYQQNVKYLDILWLHQLMAFRSQKWGAMAAIGGLFQLTWIRYRKSV